MREPRATTAGFHTFYCLFCVFMFVNQDVCWLESCGLYQSLYLWWSCFLQRADDLVVSDSNLLQSDFRHLNNEQYEIYLRFLNPTFCLFHSLDENVTDVQGAVSLWWLFLFCLGHFSLWFLFWLHFCSHYKINFVDLMCFISLLILLLLLVSSVSSHLHLPHLF